MSDVHLRSYAHYTTAGSNLLIDLSNAPAGKRFFRLTGMVVTSTAADGAFTLNRRVYSAGASVQIMVVAEADGVVTPDITLDMEAFEFYTTAHAGTAERIWAWGYWEA